jgi:hypothetical protein
MMLNPGMGQKLASMFSRPDSEIGANALALKEQRQCQRPG